MGFLRVAAFVWIVLILRIWLKAEGGQESLYSSWIFVYDRCSACIRKPKTCSVSFVLLLFINSLVPVQVSH